jgi:hypothetical protein
MMKREIPLLITFLTGLLMVVQFFVPHRPIGQIGTGVLSWYTIIAGFTLLLGIDSLVGMHLKKLQRKQSGWGYSIMLILGLLLALGLGIFSEIKYGSALAFGSPFMYLYTYMMVPLQATMFSLLAFFIASAAYRAFRARTLEASLLLVAAMIVMLGRVPLGAAIWGKFPILAEWIMTVPNAAATRGILIGVALGGLAMSLRILLGIERTYLS